MPVNVICNCVGANNVTRGPGERYSLSLFLNIFVMLLSTSFYNKSFNTRTVLSKKMYLASLEVKRLPIESEYSNL